MLGAPQQQEVFSDESTKRRKKDNVQRLGGPHLHELSWSLMLALECWQGDMKVHGVILNNF
jgi:hypothetical protein